MTWGATQWSGSWSGSWHWPMGGLGAPGASMTVSIVATPGLAAGGAAAAAAGAAMRVSASTSGAAQGRSTAALAMSLAASWRQKGRWMAKVGAGPSISGVKAPGAVLTVDPGRLAGAASGIRYQWHVGRMAVPGATGQSFIVRVADTGQIIECGVILEFTGGAAPFVARHIG